MGRNKKEENDKKKKISLSINNSVIDMVDNYINKEKTNRSKLIEKLWSEYLENKK